MVVLCLGVNLANFVSTQSDLNRILTMITENKGTIPKIADETAGEAANETANNNIQPPGQDSDAGNPEKDAASDSAVSSRPDIKPDNKPDFKPDGPFTSETPYSTRYFVLFYDDDGNLTDSILDNIASVTEDDLPAYLKAAAATGEGYGYTNGYKYYVSYTGQHHWIAVFLDAYQQLRSVTMLALLSLGVTVICIALVYIIVRAYSRKAIEPMLENARRQKQFITDASHELKTPITVIATSLTVLEMDVGRQKWIDKAMAQTEKLKNLVNSLVTLSRMDEEDTPLNFSLFNVSDAVRETAESFDDFAKSKGLALSFSITPDISYCGDEYAIRQLVSILLDNAIKYAREGTEISFFLKGTAKGIVLGTSNLCAGEAPDKPDNLFDRFYRADESRNSSTGGFGIGLSIAKSIAEGHHGNVHAEVSGDQITFTAELK